jgi:2-polyprenyl-3-methyl-5-hydroxy-6-metoxy-1,4-benzoquinol methylase
MISNVYYLILLLSHKTCTNTILTADMDIKELEIFQNSPFKERHPWELARMSVIRRLLHQMLSQSGSHYSRVLDVGSGDAFVIQNLSRLFPDLEFIGFDSAYTPAHIESFARRPEFCRCKLYQNMDSLRNKEDFPDIALFLDVLEHVTDDAGLLQQAASVLKPNGFVLITAPAFQSLFCSHDAWLGHLRRYSRQQLETLSRQAGLEPVEAGYFFSCLLLPRLCRTLYECLRPTKKQLPVGIGEWPHGLCLSSIFKMCLILNAGVDLWLRKHHLPNVGLSVYALCRKSA